MPAQPGQPLSIVILAAGQGKRMKSDLPKVLQPLAGKPLLRHVIDTACTLQPVSLHVVYGHGGDVVRGALADAPVSSWCLQAEQLGTGHAVQQALPALHDGELALILYGDVPLVSADTLRSLVALAGPKTMSLLTVMLEDPTGYGRIVRDARGKVRRIVEQKDATEAERAIREINPSYYCFRTDELLGALARVGNKNASGEYYITDVFEILRKDGRTVAAVDAVPPEDVLSVNGPVQLAEVDAILRKRHAKVDGSVGGGAR